MVGSTFRRQVSLMPSLLHLPHRPGRSSLTSPMTPIANGCAVTSSEADQAVLVGQSNVHTDQAADDTADRCAGAGSLGSADEPDAPANQASPKAAGFPIARDLAPIAVGDVVDGSFRDRFGFV